MEILKNSGYRACHKRTRCTPSRASECTNFFVLFGCAMETRKKWIRRDRYPNPTSIITRFALFSYFFFFYFLCRLLIMSKPFNKTVVTNKRGRRVTSRVSGRRSRAAKTFCRRTLYLTYRPAASFVSPGHERAPSRTRVHLPGHRRPGTVAFSLVARSTGVQPHAADNRFFGAGMRSSLNHFGVLGTGRRHNHPPPCLYHTTPYDRK